MDKLTKKEKLIFITRIANMQKEEKVPFSFTGSSGRADSLRREVPAQ